MGRAGKRGRTEIWAMPLRLCVLGSGSGGNCIYVASPQTALLIDAGLSGQEILRRLASIGANPASLAGVCVTHEHKDHCASLGVLQLRLQLPLYVNGGTLEALSNDASMASLRWTVFTTGCPFEIGDLRVSPFSVPHDAFEPVGFLIEHGPARAGVVTDMGAPTELVRARLRCCQVVVLEANHDETLLRSAERPWTLKQRIAGRQGHLSNVQAAELIAQVSAGGLRVVYLAHLSAECNRPELALRTVSSLLARKNIRHVSIKLTAQDTVSDVEEWF